MSPKDNLHANHRNRMKERFLAADETGTADISFSDHELLEILLFHSQPRVNTNETAHLLLNEFGSLRGILQAPAAALMHVKGIGISSAVLIRLISSILRRVIREQNSRPTAFRMNELKDLVPLFRNLYFLQMSDEKIHLLMFDAGGTLIKTVRLSDGTQNSVPIDIPRCVQIAVMNKASSVVLVHNHPAFAPPSDDDREITELLAEAFDGTGITLIEHIVFTDDFCFGLLHDTVFSSGMIDQEPDNSVTPKKKKHS